jgi:foldase protein PrsA
MRTKRLIAALGALFALAIGLSACGSDVPGDSVADMAGNPITVKAFNHWLYVDAKGNAAQSPGAPVIVPTDPPSFKGCIAQVRKQIPALAKTPDKTIVRDCNQLFQSLSSTVMRFLIQGYWYQAEATRLHVKVSDAQIQKAYDTAKKASFPTATAFNTFLSETGETPQDLKYRYRIQQIFKALLAKHSTTVTPALISAYYNSHKSQFGTPASRDIRIVLTKTAAQANAAKAALAGGKSWIAVARQYSTDTATKNNGGLLSGITQGQEEHALDVAAFAAPKNKLQGPIKGTFGYYVFQVINIRAATQQSLAKSEQLIKQLLTSQTQTSAQSAIDKTAKQHWLSKTKCRSAYAMALCSGYTPPKTNTTTTPTPTGSTAAPTTTTSTTTSTTKKK